MEKKKLCQVDILGATVTLFAKEKIICFIDTERFLYWMDLRVDKNYSKMGFVEGQQVWLYVVKEKGRVIGVVPFGGERLEDMPTKGPVEL